ncbi:hypothetical protein CTAYLR_007011 [Chrysophaeum taylorii]|uniref:Transmembrane protein 107 n=1 Tax=Chrysophaeum taylorii TaxID=2483200 RepID=A0AAD7U8M2_9STRA|nr:hypothetical protein CTAYLR_007011 [Chrysophaeum taylorii]
MGGRILEVLIPTRFVLTTGHLVATMMIVYTKKQNLDAGLPVDPSKSRYDSAKAEFHLAYVLSLVCFVFDMIGIFCGTSIFFVKANVLQIACHFVGGVLVASMIEQAWQYQYLWLIFAFCNVPTAVLEIIILIMIFCLNVYIY